MLAMMPFLSAYWPHILTIILAYSSYVLIFGKNRLASLNDKKSLPKNLEASSQTKVNQLDPKDEDDEDEVTPTTFPEDTPHIPYNFDEISEVRKLRFLVQGVLNSVSLFFSNKVFKAQEY